MKFSATPLVPVALFALVSALMLTIQAQDSPKTAGESNVIPIDKPRTWTNQDGKKLEATLLVVRGETVIIERTADERLFRIPLSTLSKSDQELIRAHFAEEEEAEEKQEVEANSSTPALPTVVAKREQPEAEKTRLEITENENVIVNPGFEKSDLIGWKPYDADTTQSEVIRDPDVAAEGRRCLKLLKTRGIDVGYYYQNPFRDEKLPWNCRIIGTAKVKVDKLENPDDFYSVALRARVADAAGMKLLYESDKVTRLSSDWQDLEFELEIPSRESLPQMADISIAVQVYGADNWSEPVYFDDVRLKVVPIENDQDVPADP
ncbi:MAG: hypothetical protein HKN23_02375 [Verrucomicrobiales bacterium]|nr:hypothetical protein [Verrucomicrobiales bacterium]